MRLSTAVMFAVAASASFAQADENNGIAPRSAPAGEVRIGDTQDTYGTASLTAYMVPSTAFTPRNSANTYSVIAGIDRFVTGATSMESAAMLPSGALIQRIELRACDTDATAQVNVNLATCQTIGSACSLAASVGTGTAATPGCNTFSLTLANTVIVDNTTVPMLLSVTTGTTSATTFQAVKIYYRLQVSPGPAFATFPTDVPTTHPFFRFVEALAAAGITGGCGTGTYCPDAPVTRGQMAVFLATALGLHFPN
jgi:hypothetical protein